MTPSVINNIGAVHANRAVFGTTGGRRPMSRREESRQQTGRLDDSVITQTGESYVRPPKHEDAAQALGQDHVAIIHGPPGVGKTAGAIVLLRGRTREALEKINPALTVAELARFPYKSGIGYLVVDHAEGRRVHHADFEWNKVRDAVRDEGAFLVVTRREPVSPDVESVKMIGWEPPSMKEVLNAHLPKTPTGEQAAAYLHGVLPADCAMRTVAAIAKRVVGGAPVEEALQSLDLAAGDVVRGWFDAGPTWRDLLEVTATAFGSGVSAEEFATRYAALERVVPPEQDGRDDSNAQSLSPNCLVIRDKSGVPAFAQPAFRDRVLAKLRERQPGSYWAAVARWIMAIIERVGADDAIASGLARLALADPLTVEETYLVPWSGGSAGRIGQNMAACVVSFMAADEQTVSTALRIVRDWVTGSRSQRQAAALALSGELGVRFPTEAAKEFRTLLEKAPCTGDQVIDDSLGRLLGTLAVEGLDGSVVLDLLSDLNDDVAHHRSPVSRDGVARSVRAVLTAGDKDNPAIAALLRRRADCAGAVGRLWGKLHAHPDLWPDAALAVQSAIGNVEGDDRKAYIKEFEDAHGAVIAEASTGPPSMGPTAPVLVDDRSRRYPVAKQVSFTNRSLAWLSRRRLESALPELRGTDVLVFRVDGGHVLDPGGPEGARLLRRTDHVSVVDRTKNRPVQVPVLLRPAAPSSFSVLVTFTCSVTDAVAVVREGIEDARQHLHDHLCSHRPLLALGDCRNAHEVDEVRRDAAARVQAFLAVRPADLPGLTVTLTRVDVEPPVTSSTAHKEAEDAD